MSDQFRKKAEELQKRAKDAMGSKGEKGEKGEGKSRGRQGETERGRGDMTDRAKQMAKEGMDRAKKARKDKGH